MIKRRTLAKEICDRRRVSVNGRLAKAGTEINSGDILEINFGHRVLKLEVVSIQGNVPAKLADELYKIIEDDAT